MNKIEEIINMLKEVGLDGVDFLCHKDKPTVQKNGDRYEIMSITSGDGILEIIGIKVYPSFEYKLSCLTVDSRWRSSSLNHIQEIIETEINRLYKYEI